MMIRCTVKAPVLVTLVLVGAVLMQVTPGAGQWAGLGQPVNRRPVLPPVEVPVQQQNIRPVQKVAQAPVAVPVAARPFVYNPASAAVTELARAVGRILGQKNKAAVFSPVSIASALSLLLIGASRETKHELIRVLGFQRYSNNLDTIHQLYSDMLNDLAKTEYSLTPPRWRTSNPCYDDDDDDGSDDGEGYPKPIEDTIRVTNAVFVREGLRLSDNFIWSTGRYYNSTAANVPFASDPNRAAQYINAWADRSTEGKIRDIVSAQIAAESEMIVASALYFKGLWSEPFERQATEMKPFYPDGYEQPSKQVPAMITVGCFPYYDAQKYDAKIIGLSYQGNKSALYIIMPNNSTRSRMIQFQSNLTPAMIGEMVQSMTMRKMYLQLPKMSITNTINLRDVLQQLGVRTLFNRGLSDLSDIVARPTPIDLFATRLDADSSGSFVFPSDNVDPEPTDSRRRGSDSININGESVGSQDTRVPQSQLHVSEFIHRVELDINEKGTEGGAITTSTVFRALPSIHVRIDAPFLLLLGHDETRLPLFYGSIFDPTP
ncbi:serpin 16 [Anopheles sinensis]|uniref:Serpin 16 n=1 Tax=Anopheles sinensis TaxID=74873 RepID=A0A084WQM2_ANOSI|nr:serpin 16 [Anopheles sinensis]